MVPPSCRANAMLKRRLLSHSISVGSSSQTTNHRSTAGPITYFRKSINLAELSAPFLHDTSVHILDSIRIRVNTYGAEGADNGFFPSVPLLPSCIGVAMSTMGYRYDEARECESHPRICVAEYYACQIFLCTGKIPSNANEHLGRLFVPSSHYSRLCRIVRLDAGNVLESQNRPEGLRGYWW